MNLTISKSILPLFFMLGTLVPMASFAGSYFYGNNEGLSAEKSHSYSGNFVVLAGDENGPSWHARSLFEEDRSFVRKVITQYGMSQDIEDQKAAVYFFDRSKLKSQTELTSQLLQGLDQNDEILKALDRTDRWFDRNQKRIFVNDLDTEPGPFQWLKFQTKGGIEGLIIVERMPRAAFFPESDYYLLEFYKSLGAMDYDPENGVEKLTGKYRIVWNHAILEIRLLPVKSEIPIDQSELADVLKTVTQFFDKMSSTYPAPWYFTEQFSDHPKTTFCYTATPLIAEAFKKAGYDEKEDRAFDILFPHGMKRSDENEPRKKAYCHPFTGAEIQENSDLVKLLPQAESL